MEPRRVLSVKSEKKKSSFTHPNPPPPLFFTFALSLSPFQGIAVGMSSTAIPVTMVSVSVLTAYWLGRSSQIGGEGHSAGLFGTAVATMGMLSSAGYILAMNNYGPIADNAGKSPAMCKKKVNPSLLTTLLPPPPPPYSPSSLPPLRWYL